MKHFWSLWLCPLLLQAAQLPPVPRTEEGLPRGPKPFSSNHYDLLMEYSPFVKSVEAAKETEKSPKLVVVGYGRSKGEDHVIVQQKENSEKREKIGARFGSREFPYRLVSVENPANRKTFKAVLEGRDGKTCVVEYGAEPKAQKSEAPASPNPNNNQPTDAPASSSSQEPSKTPNSGQAQFAPADLNSVEGLYQEVNRINSNLIDPKWEGDRDKAIQIRDFFQKKLNEKIKSQNNLDKPPQNFNAGPIAPEGGQ